MSAPDDLFAGGGELGELMRPPGLVRHAPRPGGRLAPRAPHLRPHHAHLPPADVRLVGRRADQSLQRRLPRHRRREASGRAGTARVGRVAGDLGLGGPPRRLRDAAERGDLRRGPPPHHAPIRLPRGDLLHLLLQPGAQRRGRHRRDPLRQHRRYPAHHRRAPARAPARARGRGGRGAHRARRLRPQRPGARHRLARPALRAPLPARARAQPDGAGGGRRAAARSSRRTAGGGARRHRAVAAGRRAPYRSAARDHRFLPGGHPARRRLGPPAVASRRPPAVALRRVRPRRRVRRRAQSLPAVRRRLPRVPGAGRRADRGGDGQRPGLRGRARARRGAGRAGPGEDRVLLQREPRVPHPAHPPARPVGGGSRPLGSGRGAGRARADAHRAPERSPAAQAGEYPAGFRPHRGGAGEGELPPDRPPVAHGRAGLQLPVGGGADRPPLRGALPPARGAGLGGPRHVGEDRPQPRLQRLQVHLRRRDHRRAARGRPRSGADGRGHRHRHPRGRPAPALRAVPPGGGIARAAPTRAPASGSRWSRSWRGCTVAA